ncbi:MAG: hypothetical protein R6U96_01310 [Promethearchaeia archaeon]
MQTQAEAGSIDELEGSFGGEDQKLPLPLFIRDEMQAHASNLQVWAEHDYDTTLLHRSLAFPLLKELTKAGDEKAARVFRREIKKRFLSGYPPVQEFLREEGYLKFLSAEDLKDLRQRFDEEINFIDIELFLKRPQLERGVPEARKELIENIRLRFQENDYQTVEHFLKYDYLEYLTQDEIDSVPELKRLSALSERMSDLQLLINWANSGNQEGKERLKEVVSAAFADGKFYIKTFFIKKGCLDFFTEDERKALTEREELTIRKEC